MIEVQLNLRPHQRRMRDAKQGHRWECVVLHRRAGKSFYCVADLFEEALTTKRKDWRGYYIGPSFKQAKAIAFDYLQSFVKDIPGIEINQAELRVDFPNGSRIALLGVESADSLRGRYADRVICDEAQLWPLSVWTYVLRPMLGDRKGTALITGTPAGKHNLLGWAHETAQKDDDWFHLILKQNETGALDDDELKDMRKQMSDEAWKQEMECSFTASLQGAYYSRQMDRAEAERRIGRVAYDNALPVFCALDLGFSDALAIWYGQENGNVTQFFKYEEHHGMSLDHLADHWQAQPFPIEKVILPHDARARELGTGKSRLEVLRKRGVNCDVAPNLPIHDGIEACRLRLDRCWFDADGCEKGLEALRAYRSEYDEARQVMRLTPVHDWASHGADAFRYFAVMRDRMMQTTDRPAWPGQPQHQVAANNHGYRRGA